MGDRCPQPCTPWVPDTDESRRVSAFIRAMASPGWPNVPSWTHVDEEEGHLKLSNPPAHTLPHTPAKAQVPEVDEFLVFIQPSGWVELARIEEEGGVLAQGIGGHLHQCLGTRQAES